MGRSEWHCCCQFVRCILCKFAATLPWDWEWAALTLVLTLCFTPSALPLILSTISVLQTLLSLIIHSLTEWTSKERAQVRWLVFAQLGEKVFFYCPQRVLIFYILSKYLLSFTRYLLLAVCFVLIHIYSIAKYSLLFFVLLSSWLFERQYCYVTSANINSLSHRTSIYLSTA